MTALGCWLVYLDLYLIKEYILLCLKGGIRMAEGELVTAPGKLTAEKRTGWLRCWNKTDMFST